MELKDNIDRYLKEKAFRKPKKRDYFYVSEIGRTKKQIYESLHGSEFKVSPQLQRIFDNGNGMHERYTEYFKQMGILVADEIDAVQEDYLHGRLDCLIKTDGVKQIVELKSCNDRIFHTIDKPTREHNIQLQFYLYYMDIEDGIILYENKNTQAIKIFNVKLDMEYVENYIIKLKELLQDIKDEIPQENEYI